MVAYNETIPLDWRLATVNDVRQNQEKARAVITMTCSVCLLADGKISGSGYSYEVQNGSFPGLSHMLLLRNLGKQKDEQRNM